MGIRAGQRWLELGPGTGSISLGLITKGIDYVGLDRSATMLQAFRDRLGRAGLKATLHLMDANELWPVDNGSIDVIFSARAVHHLDVHHVASECVRVGRPGPVRIVLGRVRRPPGSVKVEMRRRMLQLLELGGYRGIDLVHQSEAVLDVLTDRGGERIPPEVVARWTRLRSPVNSLDDWQRRAGLADLDIPPEVKSSVLNELRLWATQHYGDLETRLQQEEWFEILGAVLNHRPDRVSPRTQTGMTTW